MKRRLIAALLAALLLLPMTARAAEAEAEAKIRLSPQTLLVNGAEIECEKYNIDGYNYFKLRDLALLLTDTAARFAVDYDAERNAVVVTTGQPYTAIGGELEQPDADRSANARRTPQTLYIDGKERQDLTVWNIGGNNFFRLRELGEALGFAVDYDGARNAALVDSAPAEPEDAWHALRGWVQRSYNGFTADGDQVYWRSAAFGRGVWSRCGVSLSEDGETLRLLFQGFTSVRGEIYASLCLSSAGTVHEATLQYYSTELLTAVPFYGEASINAEAFSADCSIAFDTVSGWPEDTPEKPRMAKLLRSSILDALELLDALLAEAAPDAGYTLADFGFSEDVLPKKQDSSPFATTDLALPLMLYSHDGGTYLGQVALDGADSIWNRFGPYGSPESGVSIYNESGPYGGSTSDESPFNSCASAPPLLLDADGGFVGYVSDNEDYVGAWTLREIRLFLMDRGF